MGNATKAFVNNSVIGLMGNFWATYRKYVAGAPTIIKNSGMFKDEMTKFEALVGQFNGTMLNAIASYYQLVDEYVANITGTIVESYYQTIISYTETLRSAIFTMFSQSASTLNCSSRMTAAMETVYKAYGGPAALFNCSFQENNVFQKLQNLTTLYINNFNTDITLYLAVAIKCLYAGNVTDDPNTPYPYSVEHCLKTVSSELTNKSFRTFYFCVLLPLEWCILH
jgi:hypothetical protein